jgi:hypothetical protein
MGKAKRMVTMQDCIDSNGPFTVACLMAMITLEMIVLMNARQLENNIPSFKKKHYFLFQRGGGGYGAKEEFFEIDPYKRMHIPWKHLGFSDTEADMIVRQYLYTAAELVVCCLPAFLICREIVMFLGRALGICG